MTPADCSGILGRWPEKGTSRQKAKKRTDLFLEGSVLFFQLIDNVLPETGLRGVAG
jgi:hypothetical protein